MADTDTIRLCPQCGDEADLEDLGDPTTYTLCHACGYAFDPDAAMGDTMECPCCNEYLYRCPGCREFTWADQQVEDAWHCDCCGETTKADRWEKVDAA